ncbi:hypothetical protein [Actinomadura alba]|uniref:Uncharacterized protein n=1 Tax=Actinomadura alba TaxID=406431 RepID=A0ABR7LQB4_9ACTN|nr:hypothetical protein [Actinomadura alba]MBC6467042.1 hypothetical protein [Actinomadura alba]
MTGRPSGRSQVSEKVPWFLTGTGVPVSPVMPNVNQQPYAPFGPSCCDAH